MASSHPLLDGVLRAQTANSTLSGDELRRAARRLVTVAAAAPSALLAVDAAGERLVGAAILLSGDLRLVDRSRRLDGESVMLVAGHIAGTAALVTAAGMAIAMGAERVQAVVLGDTPGSVDGCGQVHSLSEARHLVAL
jgi:hypothetical protein